MRFSDQHTIPVERDQLFEAFQDPVALAAEVPGCTSLTRTGPNAYTATLDMDIPCVQGRYRVDVEVAEAAAPSAATLEVRAAGTPGGGRARVDVELVSVEAGTQVRYDADAQITGGIATVGQRLLASVVQRTVVDHLDAVAASVAGTPPPQASPTSHEAGSVPVATEVVQGSKVPSDGLVAEFRTSRRTRLFTALALGAAIVAAAGFLLGRRFP